MSKLWQDVMDILQAPFVGDLDIMHLFVLIGLVLIFIALWYMILYHIRIAAQEVV